MSKFVKVVAGLAILGIVIAVLLMTNLGTLIQLGVEEGGTMILEVPTTLEGASVSLLGGSAGLDRLTIGSPEGFDAPEMFSLNHAYLDIDLMSLASDEVVIHEVVVDGAQITLELSGGTSNWGALLEQLEREPTDETTKEPSSTDEGETKAEKKIAVTVIRFTNCSIRIAGIPLAKTMTVPLPDLEITELRSADGSGVQARELLATTVSSLFKAIIGAVEGVLPIEQFNALTLELAAVLGDVGELVEDAGTVVGEAVGGAAEEAAGALEGAVEGIGSAVEGLFGGGGDAEKPDEDQ